MYKEYAKAGNILVVEDNQIDVLVVKALLDKHFHIHIATSGQEALEALEKMHFDIVLADINLGDDHMDGVQLMKMIRENPKYSQTKVFAVTAYYENRDLFIQHGFEELLTKPVIKEEILDILSASIKKTQSA
jgi:CheY-like chemotaxis protein